MLELDRLVVVLLDRFPVALGGQPNVFLQKQLDDYLSLRFPSVSELARAAIPRFEKSCPVLLRTLVYASCIDDPDSAFKSALRFHRAAVREVQSQGVFPVPSEFVFGSQMNPVFIRRWMRNTIRRRAVAEARVAELERMQIELDEEVKLFKAERDYYDAKSKSNPPLGKHERQGIRMVGDCVYAFQEVNRKVEHQVEHWNRVNG
jgi:hypothetical protein